MIIEFIRTRLKSIRNALAGWWHVIRTQKNAWIHALATGLVVIMASWLRVSMRDWSVLILTIAMVWTAEFLNTALEIVVDLASPNLHPLARAGKDVGAAAVLITALSSIIIGFLILGPPLVSKVRLCIDTCPLFE